MTYRNTKIPEYETENNKWITNIIMFILFLILEIDDWFISFNIFLKIERPTQFI